MPYMKKRAFRRKRYNRKRPFYRNRRFRKSVPRFRKPNNVYNFKRTVELENFVVTGGVNFTGRGYYFKLSDVPAVSEFTNLFDSYRLLGVKVTIYPPYNIAWLPITASNAPIGEFYSIVDYNDAINPQSASDLAQYQSLHRTWGSRPHRRYFKPKLLQTGLVDGDSTTSGLANLSGKPWLDINTRDIRYYGLKIGWASSVGTDVKGFTNRVTATYYFQCKYVK